MPNSGTAGRVHLAEEVCTVYEDRLAVCRYYALGTMGVRKRVESKQKISFSESKKIIVMDMMPPSTLCS